MARTLLEEKLFIFKRRNGVALTVGDVRAAGDEAAPSTVRMQTHWAPR